MNSQLDGILVIFNREFEPKGTFVNSILTRMEARGRPYKEWMTPSTPVRILIHPDAQNPATIAAQAAVQFRKLGIPFSLDRLEHATFEGSYGISGAIATHWSSTAEAAGNLLPGAADHERVTVKAEHGKDTIHAEGRSASEAMKQAKARVPSIAFEVSEAEVVQEGRSGVVELTANSEHQALNAWESSAPPNAAFVSLECSRKPRKGFLGLGRRKGTWRIHWSSPYIARVSFKNPAVRERVAERRAATEPSPPAQVAQSAASALPGTVQGTCKRCGKRFAYDAARWGRKGKYYCDECDALLWREVKKQFGSRTSFL